MWLRVLLGLGVDVLFFCEGSWVLKRFDKGGIRIWSVGCRDSGLGLSALDWEASGP